MESLSKLITWLKSFPIWLRAIALLCIAGLALIASMAMTSCGTTRAVVHNSANGTSTEIKITTNNPTSVDVSPNVKLNNQKDEKL